MGIPDRFAGQQWHPSTRIDRLHDTTKKRTGARRNDRFLMFSVVKPQTFNIRLRTSDLSFQSSVIRFQASVLVHLCVSIRRSIGRRRN